MKNKKIKPNPAEVVPANAEKNKQTETQFTPDSKMDQRSVLEEETPPAEELDTTPKQPLYEDKTETFYQEKSTTKTPKK